jgi:carboxylesterase type B
VLVYIHGGGFGFGDVIKCGFDKITKNYASRGLITVTVPYRVGLYGFMSLGTTEDPGNLGLWDQTAALKFVKNNIKNFGGNDENITIWGQSAGSASVDLMAMSPHSRDYFHKVIQASGSALDEWASTAPVVKITKQLAKFMGCESEDPKEIKAFLKKQKWEDILEISSTKFDPNDKTKDTYIGFGPRLDDDFFDGKTVEQLIEESPKKPTIMGLMTLEGGIFLAIGLTPDDLKTYSGKNISNAIKYRYAAESRAGKDAPALQKDLIEYFVNRDAPTSPNPQFYLQRHGELASDLMFNQEVFKEADLKTKLGWPVYFYFWNHMSKAMYAATGNITKGAWHSYELSYSFDQQTYPQDVKGPDEMKVQNYFADIFAQFAKTGNPKSDTLPFPLYTVEKQEALWIDPELSVKSKVWEDRRKFWDNVTEKYDYNVLRGRTREQMKNRYTDF